MANSFAIKIPIKIKTGIAKKQNIYDIISKNTNALEALKREIIWIWLKAGTEKERKTYQIDTLVIKRSENQETHRDRKREI